MSNEEDDALSPGTRDEAGQTDEFPAQAREGQPSALDWEPQQQPPQAPSPGLGTAAPYRAGSGQAGDTWWDQPAGGAYAPTARQVAWRGRRGRGWAVAAGVMAVLVVGAAGGFAGYAIRGSSAAPVRPASALSPSANRGFAPGTGTGSGSGSANGSGFPNGYPPGYGNGNGPGTGSGFGGEPFGGYEPSGTAPNTGGTGPSDASSIAAHVDPGLVDVNTTIDYGSAQAAGTGMVLTSGGEILTNNHVIDGATKISVTDVGNGRTYKATVAGYSVAKDVAVLKLAGASGLQTVTAASSDRVSAGEEVVGIGNAGGSGGTPSYAGGTITAMNQPITASDDLTGTSEKLTGMIETNADIQAGDSGGPLVNAAGRVVGMDTAGSGTSQFGTQSGGSAFAIPIGVATAIAGQIMAGHSSGTVHIGSTAFLGVRIGQSTNGPGTGIGSGFGGSGDGVRISGVVSGSPAARSGLAAGDAITDVGGHSVTSQSALQAIMVNDVKPGQTVTVRYADAAGQQRAVSVVLASGPPA